MSGESPGCRPSNGTELQGSCNMLQTWMDEHGVGKYAENFQRAGAGLDLLPVLTDADLQAMGVSTMGARKRILLGAADLKEEQEAANGRENIAPIAPNEILRNRGTSNSLLCFFSKGLPGAEIAPPLDAKKKTGASSSGAKPSGWAHSGAAAGKQRRWGGPKAAAVFPFRDWQLIAGTNFVVDRFCNLPPSTPTHKHWFLTHFHADHYKGLTSKFNRGTIYCTPVTAALVRQQLRVRPEVLQTVAIGSSIAIQGVWITFLPANHCPGAAMIVFQVPGRLPVLHTGDCRLAENMQELPELQAIRGAADLILDTTYCDPQYTFPPQKEALRFVVDAVKAEAFNPKTLFMFGSYTIGKESLYLKAAKVLGCKVYVSATKKKILDCLDLSPDEAALLTTDDTITNLHAVPLWMVSHKHMTNSLKFYRGRFTNVVGFQPTGWTHTRDTSSTKAGRRRKKGTIITYSVPYSEHSSFSELKEFVAWFRPRSIIPSVNNDGGGPKAQRMLQLLSG